MYKIDFIFLLNYAKYCIPPTSPFQESFFESLSENYYNQFSKEERKRMFDTIVKNESFSLDNQACVLFHNRFNPNNQYLVSAKKDLLNETILCYDHYGQMHISKNVSVQEKYIIKIEKATN
jgi:hypothetical protein